MTASIINSNSSSSSSSSAGSISRTDVHRPSVINPEEYEFVSVQNDRVEGIAGVIFLQEQRKILTAHMFRTGGTWSKHSHGGSCHICGAHAHYTCVFHHAPTNSYICTGFDCAEKLEYSNPVLFRTARKVVEGVRKAEKTARDNRAGINKAQILLKDHGLETVWDIFGMTGPEAFSAGLIRKMFVGNRQIRSLNDVGDDVVIHFVEEWCFETLKDIVSKLIKYGSLSDKQWSFLKGLVEKCTECGVRHKEREAKAEKENEGAEDAPAGRVVVEGEVLCVKAKEQCFGYNPVVVYKMLVRDDRGFRVWTTLTAKIEDKFAVNGSVSKGDRVKVKVTLTPSDDDKKFAFGSRPSPA